MARKSGQSRPARRSDVIELPHAWSPYPWQQGVLDAYHRGIRRFFIVVHRRAGKDQIGLNLAAIASQQRIGTYTHVFPWKEHVRNAIWKGMDKRDGVRFIDQAFPEELRAAKRDTPMEIELRNGSMWRCIGSDNLAALRGSNQIGVVFSEFAFAHPDAWPVIAPIMRENGGWAMFITTPNGKNHAHDMYQSVKDNPEWYVKHLTIDQTWSVGPNGEWLPLISSADLDQERASGMAESDIRREYFCDWDAALKGAYYDTDLQRMRSEGRVKQIDYDPKRPVVCAWDLGYADELVALFLQRNGGAHYCIGSRSWTFTKYQDALDDIRLSFPWTVERHLLPHDSRQHSAQTGASAAELFESLGLEVEIVESLQVSQGIQAVRAMLPTLWIDNAKREWAPTGNNGRLIEALAGYRTKQSKDGTYSRTPAHTWESHWCDALRMYAVGAAGGLPFTQWGPKPDYSLQDRAIV